MSQGGLPSDGYPFTHGSDFREPTAAGLWEFPSVQCALPAGARTPAEGAAAGTGSTAATAPLTKGNKGGAPDRPGSPAEPAAPGCPAQPPQSPAGSEEARGTAAAHRKLKSQGSGKAAAAVLAVLPSEPAEARAARRRETDRYLAEGLLLDVDMEVRLQTVCCSRATLRSCAREGSMLVMVVVHCPT